MLVYAGLIMDKYFCGWDSKQNAMWSPRSYAVSPFPECIVNQIPSGIYCECSPQTIEDRTDLCVGCPLNPGDNTHCPIHRANTSPNIFIKRKIYAFNYKMPADIYALVKNHLEAHKFSYLEKMQVSLFNFLSSPMTVKLSLRSNGYKIFYRQSTAEGKNDFQLVQNIHHPDEWIHVESFIQQKGIL